MQQKTKPKWLPRGAAFPLPYLCLCLSEVEYFATLKQLKIPKDSLPRWVARDGGGASFAHFDNDIGELAGIVCISPPPNCDGIRIAAMLVHEAVHVWQRYAKDIGETNPGNEQEAYAIQIISQNLFIEYARRISLGA